MAWISADLMLVPVPVIAAAGMLTFPRSMGLPAEDPNHVHHGLMDEGLGAFTRDLIAGMSVVTAVLMVGFVLPTFKGFFRSNRSAVRGE